MKSTKILIAIAVTGRFLFPWIAVAGCPASLLAQTMLSRSHVHLWTDWMVSELRIHIGNDLKDEITGFNIMREGEIRIESYKEAIDKIKPFKESSNELISGTAFGAHRIYSRFAEVESKILDNLEERLNGLEEIPPGTMERDFRVEINR